VACAVGLDEVHGVADQLVRLLGGDPRLGRDGREPVEPRHAFLGVLGFEVLGESQADRLRRRVLDLLLAPLVFFLLHRARGLLADVCVLVGLDGPLRLLFGSTGAGRMM
jgi:hypothetical protein